jgi:hypothetical protein
MMGRKTIIRAGTRYFSLQGANPKGLLLERPACDLNVVGRAYYGLNGASLGKKRPPAAHNYF